VRPCLSPGPIERPLQAARLAGAGANAEPAFAKRGPRRIAHADEHHAVTGRGADGSIDEFGLALGKEQELGARHDVLVKPPRARVRPDNRDAVAVVEEFHQPRHVAVAPAEGWIDEGQPLPPLPPPPPPYPVPLPRPHP